MYDNLSKPKDRAIPSKEILFKPKRWVPPLSVGLHVGWCLFLDSFAFFSWEPGWYLWWFHKKNPFSSFSFLLSAVSSFPHLFVFLPDRSVYWLGRNVRLRCGFIQNVQRSANLSSFQTYFFWKFSCNDSKNNHKRQKKGVLLSPEWLQRWRRRKNMRGKRRCVSATDSEWSCSKR